MKNVSDWVPTKFQYREGRLRATTDTQYVRVGSRLVVDLIAHQYSDLLAAHARGTLIDLGCGNVPLFATYRNKVDQVICIDWQGSPHTINHVDHVCDLNGAIPLEANCADTVLVSDVIEHIARPWSLWSEMTRLLKPGGKVIGNVPFMYWIHESPHDYHRYTEFALRRYAADNGLEVVHLSVFGGLLEVLLDIGGKALMAVPLIGRPFASALSALGFAWYRTGAGRKIASKSGGLFPAGYFFVMQKCGTDAAPGPVERA